MSVRPKKQLGQHFLADANILGVIGRLAELDDERCRARDRARPGRAHRATSPTASPMSTRSSSTARSSRTSPQWRRSPTSTSTGATRSRSTWPRFDPPPTKLVANLPYNVATPIVAESLTGLPSLELWCVMVQREVADRFFAEPSTKAYGAVSVLVQLAARRTGFHPVARTVFRPPPNVDSALVAFRRVPLPDRFDRIKEIVEAAFAHRRKTLPNSVALAGLADARASGSGARGDRPAAGDPSRGSRARRVRRARGRAVTRASAPAKINLALVVGPRGESGKHEVATVLQRIDLGDRVSIAPAATLTVTGFAGRHARPRRAHDACCGRPRRAALARDDHEADPCRGGARRRQLRRRDRAPARERHARRAAAGRRAARPRRDARCGRPVLPRGRPAARARRRFGARTARPAAGLLGRARASARRDEGLDR